MNKHTLQSQKYRAQNPNYVKEYYEKNKTRINKLEGERRKQAKLNDPYYKVKKMVRDAVYRAKRKGKITGQSQQVLGCSYDEFITHIESQFDNIMNWDNYGKHGWHIDHIIPLDTAQNIDEAIKLSHYTNLQPMWCHDNWRKGNKIL
jgi:hypothetical protein